MNTPWRLHYWDDKISILNSMDRPVLLCLKEEELTAKMIVTAVNGTFDDLLPAAEELLEHYNEDPTSKKYSYPTAERLRVAIAKARGEQP